MKTFTLATTALLALLAPAAMADFDVYYTIREWDHHVYTVFDKEPGDNDCDKIKKADFMQPMPDASGRRGARCKGDGCGVERNPEDIEELELHFGSKGAHVTIYKNRGWGLFDTDDNKVGECVPAELWDHHSVYCEGNSGPKTDVSTEKRFFCKSDKLNVDNVWYG